VAKFEYWGCCYVRLLSNNWRLRSGFYAPPWRFNRLTCQFGWWTTYTVDDVVRARQVVSDTSVPQVLLAHVSSTCHVQTEEDPAGLLAGRDRQTAQLLFDALHQHLQLPRPNTHTHTHEPNLHTSKTRELIFDRPAFPQKSLLAITVTISQCLGRFILSRELRYTFKADDWQI